MKSITKVQKKIEPEVEPSIPAICPYCGISTVINQLLTEPACRHFEDFTLFKRNVDSFREIEDPQDKVVMSETTFRLSGSRYPRIEKKQTGELIEADNGFRLMVNGKFDSFISQDEFMDMISDDEDEDCDYVRDE